MRLIAHITALLALAAMAQPAAARCYADWSAAAPVVAREKLATAAELQAGIVRVSAGKILSITLCEEGGRHVYKVVLLEAAGKVRHLTLDARRPFS